MSTESVAKIITDEAWIVSILEALAGSGESIEEVAQRILGEAIGEKMKKMREVEENPRS